MEEGVCRPPQPSESSQGTCKAENCKTESQLSSFLIISLAPLLSYPSRSRSMLCFSDLVSSRSQCTSVLDACSLSSDRQCQCWMPILAPHLLCMTRGSPGQSLLQQCATWSVAGSSKRNTMFPSTSIKNKRKSVCSILGHHYFMFCGMKLQNYLHYYCPPELLHHFFYI